MDLLGFLENQKLFPKFYYKGDEEYAAIGALLAFDTPPTITQDPLGNLRFFGGMSFTQSLYKDDLWNDFPNSYFFLPRYELKQEKEGTQLTLHFLDTTPSDEGLKYLNFTQTKTGLADATWQKREDLPVFSDWEKMLAAALNNTNFKKVVLARRSSFHYATPLKAFSLLAQVAQVSNARVIYAFEPKKNAAFIGATPERLYVRERRNIISDAIAGTFTCKNQTQDPKLQREFLIVKDAIAEILHPLCTSLVVEKQDSTIAAHHMHHLCNHISGTLLPEITDSMLLQALHPTPAIGGYPTIAACTFIRDNEPFERGWYSAPIGWISEPSAKFAVAIRSALIKKNIMHLFAGLGVVEGSKPDLEWEELELKIGQYL